MIIQHEKPSPTLGLTKTFFRTIILAISCVITFSLVIHLLAHVYSVSAHDDLLGGMWAVVATIFVYRDSHVEGIRAALSRMSGTTVSFGLCFLYLLVLPFHVWGIAALIVVGAMFLAIIDRPDDIITASITTVVVMVVADIGPHDAWREPILRLFDTTVGVLIGLGAEWIATRGLRRLSLIGTRH